MWRLTVWRSILPESIFRTSENCPSPRFWQRRCQATWCLVKSTLALWTFSCYEILVNICILPFTDLFFENKTVPLYLTLSSFYDNLLTFLFYPKPLELCFYKNYKELIRPPLAQTLISFLRVSSWFYCQTQPIL